MDRPTQYECDVASPNFRCVPGPFYLEKALLKSTSVIAHGVGDASAMCSNLSLLRWSQFIYLPLLSFVYECYSYMKCKMSV